MGQYDFTQNQLWANAVEYSDYDLDKGASQIEYQAVQSRYEQYFNESLNTARKDVANLNYLIEQGDPASTKNKWGWGKVAIGVGLAAFAVATGGLGLLALAPGLVLGFQGAGDIAGSLSDSKAYKKELKAAEATFNKNQELRTVKDRVVQQAAADIQYRYDTLKSQANIKRDRIVGGARKAAADYSLNYNRRKLTENSKKAQAELGIELARSEITNVNDRFARLEDNFYSSIEILTERDKLAKRDLRTDFDAINNSYYSLEMARDLQVLDVLRSKQASNIGNFNQRTLAQTASDKVSDASVRSLEQIQKDINISKQIENAQLKIKLDFNSASEALTNRYNKSLSKYGTADLNIKASYNELVNNAAEASSNFSQAKTQHKFKIREYNNTISDVMANINLLDIDLSNQLGFLSQSVKIDLSELDLGLNDFLRSSNIQLGKIIDQSTSDQVLTSYDRLIEVYNQSAGIFRQRGQYHEQGFDSLGQAAGSIAGGYTNQKLKGRNNTLNTNNLVGNVES